MNTNQHNQRTCRRHTTAAPNAADTLALSNASRGRRASMMAGAVLTAVATSLSGLLGAAPASAAPTDNFVAIAGGQLNDAPPVQSVTGFAENADANSAGQRALTNCAGVGGRQCVVVVSVQGQCVAAAADDFGDFQGGFGPTPDIAFQNALAGLQNKQGAQVLRTGCAANVSVAPPPPKPGPSVTFNPILGGLEAHITDRSGVGSQCMYVMDDVSRNFALAVNATFDLKIVPAIPRFTDRNVTITCDNGTKTQTTTRF
jgi:hypothetical protein